MDKTSLTNQKFAEALIKSFAENDFISSFVSDEDKTNLETDWTEAFEDGFITDNLVSSNARNLLQCSWNHKEVLEFIRRCKKTVYQEEITSSTGKKYYKIFMKPDNEKEDNNPFLVFATEMKLL